MRTARQPSDGALPRILLGLLLVAAVAAVYAGAVEPARAPRKGEFYLRHGFEKVEPRLDFTLHGSE